MLAVGVLEIAIIFNRDSDIQIFLNGDILLNGKKVDLDGTLKWSRVGTVVVQGEKHQRSLAVRTEDTGHVSKLCVKTLFISENFHSQFSSFLCIIRNCNILHSQDVVFDHFGKTGVYAGRPLFHYPLPGRWTINNYSLKSRLKRIIVLAHTNSVTTQHIIEEK